MANIAGIADGRARTGSCADPSVEKLVLPQPIALVDQRGGDTERATLSRLGPDAVMMMGDDPALPAMPDRPTLLDFFRLRFGDIAFRHLLQSAKLAMDAGQDEHIVVACLLHDISNGCLIRADHGYWGAQMIAPYVSEEVAFAVKYHQALRYFADEEAGYAYPAAYELYFGHDYVPPDYIRRDADFARAHRWYMSARAVTMYDVYAFEKGIDIDPDQFTDIVGRHFKQPEEGLGFDGSPVAHMWRTMIWPHNFL